MSAFHLIRKKFVKYVLQFTIFRLKKINTLFFYKDYSLIKTPFIDDLKKMPNITAEQHNRHLKKTLKLYIAIRAP